MVQELIYIPYLQPNLFDPQHHMVLPESSDEALGLNTLSMIMMPKNLKGSPRNPQHLRLRAQQHPSMSLCIEPQYRTGQELPEDLGPPDHHFRAPNTNYKYKCNTLLSGVISPPPPPKLKQTHRMTSAQCIFMGSSQELSKAW